MHKSIAIYADTDSNINMKHEDRIATDLEIIRSKNRETAMQEAESRKEDCYDINLRTS